MPTLIRSSRLAANMEESHRVDERIGLPKETCSGKSDVAELSPGQISTMNHKELVDAVLAADLPLIGDQWRERLLFKDRETLVRLVYLARRCCRNQGY